MTTALYLEHYLDGLENLPQDLNRKFTEMRNLDTQSQTHLKCIKQISCELDKDQYTIAATERAIQIEKVDRMFTEAKGFADRKVILAMETYECVDKHIRSLDADLLRFELELKGLTSRKETLQKINKGKLVGRKRKDPSSGAAGVGATTSTTGHNSASTSVHNANTGLSSPAVNDENSSSHSVGRKRRKKSNTNTSILEESNEPSVPLLQRSIAEATDVMDMPVDPNEPTYCICNQVSYGEMIGCDNPDCPIEWFHFACVTLPTKKQMKWYCPRCTILRKKK